ncbi:MAG: PA14 domain-containing protein, partial [Limisphaerales bacterium]
MQRIFNLWLCFAAVVLAPPVNGATNRADTNLISLAELQTTVADQGCVVKSFRLEGIVCAVVSKREIIALQDDSATVLLELPALDQTVRMGDRLAIEGNQCVLTRTRFGIRLDTEVVNDDGEHSVVLRTSRIFLEAGRQPIRVKWFNASTSSELSLQYEGPSVKRQPVPSVALCWQPPGQTNFQRGLHFSAYIQTDVQPSGGPLVNGWHALPDFSRLKPVVEGMATNFDVRYRTRDQYAALVFTGFLKIPTSGFYTFYLESDDGSLLYVGDPSSRCKITVSRGQLVPAIRSWDQAASATGFHWSELNGTVTFAAPDENGTELELSTARGVMQVNVISHPPDSFSALLHQRITATGICETSPDGGALMVVPGWRQIKISSPAEAAAALSTNTVLTSAGQIRRLKLEQARMDMPVKIKGVVIAATADSLVLQDSSGGVFIHWSSGSLANRPRVGERWEVEGRTDPGDFSPVVFADKVKFLGTVPMPDPIRPTWDQLMDGSLDAEYVELRGAILSLSDSEMKLLTADGVVTVEGDLQRPLPQLPSLPPDSSLLGSIVRIRGCFTADWNWDTRQVIGGSFNLYPANVEIEQPAPSNPFSIPTTQAADLLTFNARASALQQVKLAGQIIYARTGEYFLLDQQTGVRVLAAQPSRVAELRTGDLIEAVGFPKLGGPAPVLQDAQIRVRGRAPLPPPVEVAETNLLDRSQDSTLVQVKGLFVGDTTHGNERVLELQSGAQHFAAVLKSDPRTWTTYAPGSLLQLTGVYASEEPELAGTALYPFEILLNNAAGITLLQQPSWWTVRRALTVATMLTATLGLAFIWITLLRRKVEQRTAQLQEEIEARQLVERHRIVEQERTRVARDLHDELGTGLTELGILGELGNNPAISSEEKRHYLRQLTGLTRTLVTGLDEIVWAINPHYDSLGSTVTYFSFFADRFLKLAGIACRLRVAEHFPEYPLNSQIRHGVFLAFKEALNNIVRHAEASEVELKITADGNELAIAIRDNGRGMAPDGT